MELLITMDMVKEAQAFLKDKTEHTQLRKSRCLPETVHIKCENLQKTGSFKIRGALNRMRFLSEAEKKKGVIAASAGNHAQGVAFGAKLYGIKATIVMPETAPMIKVLATQKYGAEVVLHGDYYDHAYEKACEIAKKEGLVFVHPYQDPYVIAGQGTIGLEILQDFAQVDQVVVPIGGGGLIGGISFVLKTINPKIEVIGVVSEQTQGMRQMKEGDIVSAPTYVNTIADGIAVKKPSPEMFKNYIHPYVDQIVSVSDNEIAEAIVNLMEKDKLIAEGSGAAGVAAVIANKFKLKPNAVVLVCGGNIDLNTMFSVIETGLRRKGRHTRISIIVSDLPGQLARITQMMAKARANILDVMHDRVSSELSVRETRIDFLLETSGIEHAQQIEQMLKDAGVHLLKGEHS